MYDERRSQAFQQSLDGPFAARRRVVEDKIRQIRTAPKTACRSEPLKWRFRGKRSARLDRRYRIIYTICEECYQQGNQERNLMDCPDCENIPTETVNFLDIIDYHV